MSINVSMTDKVDTSFFLDRAQLIGDHLVEQAIWSDNAFSCNWMGRRDIEDPEIARYAKRNVALSPELYSGSAGIALFLCQLFRLTGEATYLKTAVASWLRSAKYMKTNDFPASPISLYAGDLGLLYIANLLLSHSHPYSEQIEHELLDIQNRLWNGLSVAHGLDLIGGNAGAIPILIYLEKAFSQQQTTKGKFLQLAKDCGKEIVDKAQWKDEMCFWTSEKIHGVELELPPLTGFSHGATGLAMALLELYSCTQDESFLIHGRGAFCFEDSLFNPDQGNWIDTRKPHSKKDGKITGTFRGAWCHGAPGIGLAHLRAAQLDRERSAYHWKMATIAAKTTEQLLANKLTDNNLDMTLCHGTIGLCDIILEHGIRTSNEELINSSQYSSSIILESHSNPFEMPSGLQAGGYSPCLLVGVAGIGLHCLRQLDHSIATILLPSSG